MILVDSLSEYTYSEFLFFRDDKRKPDHEKFDDELIVVILCSTTQSADAQTSQTTHG